MEFYVLQGDSGPDANADHPWHTRRRNISSTGNIGPPSSCLKFAAAREFSL